MNRLALSILAFALPLAAGIIDITNQPVARVHGGAQINATFAVWNYGLNNPGSSPYPTSFDFSAIFQDPGAPQEEIPGTTATSYRNHLFSATLISLDGAFSVPLYDPLAALRGYEDGTMLLVPGTYQSGEAGDLDVAVVSGTVHLTPQQSRALFGPSFVARIILRNIGSDVVVGIGPGYNVRNAIIEAGLTGEGARSVGGITTGVTVSNPEPSTWLLGAGAALLLLRIRRSPAARERTRAGSRA